MIQKIKEFYIENRRKNCLIKGTFFETLFYMPVDFLTKEQTQYYGRYAGEPSLEQLARYFHLADTDRVLVEQRREEHNRLGFALQLCTVRFLGTFLSDPTDVPNNVVTYLSRQLNIKDTSCLSRYMTRTATHREHAGEIQLRYGYKDFTDQPGHFRLVRWLYTRAWLSAERPSMLFDLATARLVDHKVLLPGVTVLSRLVARIRDRSSARLWRILASLPNEEQRKRLEGLLVVPENARQTPLDKLRRPPTRISGPSLVGALNRLKEIRKLGLSNFNMVRIPIGRIKALARYASAARAQAIARMTEERRIATLVAFIKVIETTALDDALDVLDLLITELLSHAKRVGQKERLRTIRDLDAAALKLGKACNFILDDNFDDSEIRSVIYSRISKETLIEAVAIVEALTKPPDDNYYEELVDCYRRVRRFLPTLLNAVTFDGIESGQPIFKSLKFLASIEGKRKPDMSKAPLEIVPQSWKRMVIIDKEHQIDRRAYTLCVLERLQDALRRRDIFVQKSERWCDPRDKLLNAQDWLSNKANICKTLGRKEEPNEEITELRKQLDDAYLRTAENFPSNAAIRIEQENGKDTLVLTGLDKLEEPSSLIELRKKVSELLPKVDLPEVLLEINSRTGFANEFSHVSDGQSRVADLSISICAVLLSEACYIGVFCPTPRKIR